MRLKYLHKPASSHLPCSHNISSHLLSLSFIMACKFIVFFKKCYRQIIHVKTPLLIQNLKIYNLKILTSISLKLIFSWLCF